MYFFNSAHSRQLFSWVKSKEQIICAFFFFLSVEDLTENYIFSEQYADCWYTSDMIWEKKLEQYCSIKHMASIIWRKVSVGEDVTFLWIEEQPPTRMYHLHSYGQYLENNIDTTVRYVSCRSGAPE